MELPTAKEARYQQIRKITLVGVVINSVLAAGKIVLGTLGHSQALVADGVHSLADLVSDMVVIFAAKHAAREADEEHPYGHGRIETIVSVGLGIFLIAVAGGIAYDAISRIYSGEQLLTPGWLALIAAFVSILANEFLFQYTIRGAKKHNSRMLHANAWHHRTDAISSVIALIGIGGAMLGWQYMDAVAAIGVSLMITKVGWDIGWNSIQELLDSALPSDTIEQIRKTILEIDDVEAVHSLRTRSHGGQALVDVHIIIRNPYVSVSEGHKIAEVVQRKLIHTVDEITDVTVHIDPEDDETSVPNKDLPLRDDAINNLRRLWANIPEAQQAKEITLHYLDGKIDVEVVLPLEMASTRQRSDALSETLNRAMASNEQFRRASLYFC